MSIYVDSVPVSHALSITLRPVSMLISPISSDSTVSMPKIYTPLAYMYRCHPNEVYFGLFGFTFSTLLPKETVFTAE